MLVQRHLWAAGAIKDVSGLPHLGAISFSFSFFFLSTILSISYMMIGNAGDTPTYSNRHFLL